MYPETYLQMRELTLSVLDAIAADKWHINIMPEYPEIVLPAAMLVEYLDNLLDEFEWFSVRPKRARTPHLWLDKDIDRQECNISVIGSTLVRYLYDCYAHIVLRDYDWNIPASESPYGKRHSIAVRLRRGQATTMACLLTLENTGFAADFLAQVKTRLGYLLKREMAWDYNTILDKPTQQWLRLSLHRPLTPSGALWRVELVGGDFLRAFREVSGGLVREGKIITEIVACIGLWSWCVLKSASRRFGYPLLGEKRWSRSPMQGRSPSGANASPSRRSCSNTTPPTPSGSMGR